LQPPRGGPGQHQRCGDGAAACARLWNQPMANFSKSTRLRGGQGPQGSGVGPHPLKLSRPARWHRTYVNTQRWGPSGWVGDFRVLCPHPALFVCMTVSCIPFFERDCLLERASCALLRKTGQCKAGSEGSVFLWVEFYSSPAHEENPVHFQQAMKVSWWDYSGDSTRDHVQTQTQCTQQR
jgi:hypothetical protein